MLSLLRHRGPESSDVFVDDLVCLGHARLRIIDLEGGKQPLTNEDESLRLVCNGEIFNYVELRQSLEHAGHRFRTGSDCETIIHLYEEYGPDCVHQLNGQFAFALWDANHRSLLLARDRLGICPLFYTIASGKLIFGSEIKAILSQPQVAAELDPVALGEVFTTWSPVPPRTMFKGILSLRAGHILVAREGCTDVRQYWKPSFRGQESDVKISVAEAAEHLKHLLLDAIRIRLRADVPVGAYLSGGLDSSAVAGMARRHATNELKTYSIAFADQEFDESAYQRQAASVLGTAHRTTVCSGDDIARGLNAVIWHTETPLLRTAPVPMFFLSKLVHEDGFKVVLTGEGADEFLVGYDIFKETKVRAFWAKRPGSRLRPLLLRRLYGHIPELSMTSRPYLEAFFKTGLEKVSQPDFSHLVRWNNTRRIFRFLTPQIQELIGDGIEQDLEALDAGQDAGWDNVSRAQYCEATTFLEPYLLASQGDRVAMAHAVEIRPPFLDHRIVEFCNSLPSRIKLQGLNEKSLLKRAMADVLPAEIVNRPKTPYRAPIQSSVASLCRQHDVLEALDEHSLTSDGVFKPQPVRWLIDRALGTSRLSEIESMAAIGIISFGLFKRAFFDDFAARSPLQPALHEPSIVASTA